MSLPEIITPEIKAENRIEFDRVINLLSGQSAVVAKIKSEINILRSHFVSFIDILKYFPDKIDALEKSLYDMHCQTFIHSVMMCLMAMDATYTPYIKPVTPSSQVTSVMLTLKLPHYEVTKVVACVDNVSVDIASWDMYIGTTQFTAARSSELVEQYSVVAETPNPYFSQSEFVNGVSNEVEKLLLFTTQLCRMEQAIHSGMKYVAELKNLGLYN